MSKTEKRFKKGFTTGTCAQATAKAAATMLSAGKKIERVEVKTPSGVELNLELIDQEVGEDFARCGIVKDAGSDPDVTHGAKIYAEVRFSNKKGVTIKGGKGVGIVTKCGLAVPVGEYAINPVPRRMIYQEVHKYVPQGKGAEVIISVPQGEELAKRTFNPRLGIVGGISILGTTGIVEPKSVDAYKTSLALLLNMARASGVKKVVLTPGHIGERFCKERLGLPDEAIVQMGDQAGFMLKQCVKKGIKEVLLAGHIGKLVKIAAGIFNTHSKFGDARLETIAAYAGLCGADQEVIKDILSQNLAEATVEILRKNGLLSCFDEIARKIVLRASEFVDNKLKISCILLSLKGEILGSAPKGEGGNE